MATQPEVYRVWVDGSRLNERAECNLRHWY
jgi:hypothetical protein